MQFATKFFWCQFLMTNRTCSIFMPVFWYGFSASISGMCVIGISVVFECFENDVQTSFEVIFDGTAYWFAATAWSDEPCNERPHTVPQHTESMMGSIIWILLEIYFSFKQWKNFENPLRIDKVIAMSLLYYRTFWGTQCIYEHRQNQAKKMPEKCQ